MTKEILVCIACFSAALLAFLLTFPARKLAPRLGFMDVPKDERRMHEDPIPRIGGVAIFLAFVIGRAIAGELKAFLPYLIGALIIATVGMIDDSRGVSPFVKLAAQAAAAVVLCLFGINAQFFTILGITFDAWIFAYPLTVIWVMAITNMVNLIDGIDGLCAGISIFGCGAVALLSIFFGDGSVSPTALILMSACVGFLPHNTCPAKAFLGDTGSMLLGFMLAGMSMELFFAAPTVDGLTFSAFTPIALLAIPIFDTCFAIIRRIAGGQRLFMGDRKHIHHRLTARHGQRVAVLILYSVCAMLVGVAFILNISLAGEIVGIILLALLLVYAIVRFAIFGKNEGEND